MKLTFRIGAVILLFSIVAFASDGNARAKYDDFVKRIRAGDQSVDFAEFREATADAGIESDVDARDKLLDAARKRDFRKMSEAAAAVLKSNYADLDGHYFAKVAALESGNQKLLKFHDWVEMGLLKALRGTGDGKTAKTAMKVLSVEEEYFIIRLMRQQPRQQSLGTCAGHPCDIYKTYDPESQKEDTWYFDISVPMGRMAKAVGEK